MDERMKNLTDILDAYRTGDVSRADALQRIDASYFEAAGDVTVDHDRRRRTGAAEVIYGEHKTPEQILTAFEALRARG